MKLHDLKDAPLGHWNLLRAEAVDGDTITAVIHLGFNIHYAARIRLKGFFAPEHRGMQPDAANAAQTALQTVLNSGGLSIPVRGARTDKYGRCVAVLHQHGVAVNPFIALGAFQLSEHAHTEDLNFARKLAGL